MRIKVKKLPQTLGLLWAILGLSFLLGVLEGIPSAQSVGKLLLDVLWPVLLVYLIRFYRGAFSGWLWGFAGWIAAFFLVTLLVYLVRYQSALYYLWGLRNNFRFYVVFLAAAAFLRQEDGEALFKALDGLFWLNALVSLVQFFFFGIRGDQLGGIFGTASGVNGNTNLFFTIVITRSALCFLEKKEGGWRCFWKCAMALLIAALAELKFFFVLFLLILVLAVLMTDFTWRKFGLVLGGLAGALLGAAMLVKLFPSFVGWFSVNWLWQTASSETGYTASGDFNRLNAISAINEIFFHSWGQRLFGLGLGNCDTSSFEAITTPFYQAHSRLHYNWMSHSFLYLETGWIGLWFFFGFFALVFLAAGKQRGQFSRQTRILTVCCVLIGVYNSSLRTEMAYLMYAVLALPFARK